MGQVGETTSADLYGAALGHLRDPGPAGDVAREIVTLRSERDRLRDVLRKVWAHRAWMRARDYSHDCPDCGGSCFCGTWELLGGDIDGCLHECEDEPAAALSEHRGVAR